MKKIISLIIAFCMVFAASAMVFAEEVSDGAKLIMPLIAPSPFVLSNSSLTRLEAVELLWDDCGNPYVNYYAQFTDFAEGEDGFEAARWAAAEKIASGYSDGTFRPDAAVNRQQFVTMLYRYAVKSGMDVSVAEETNILSFDDFDQISSFAVIPFQWACAMGIVDTETSTLSPWAELTRLEAVEMISKMNGETGEAVIGTGIVGGWTLPESIEIPENAMEAFEKAMEGFTGVGYTPVAYLGSQVVAGINHAFLCKAQVVYPGATPYWAIVSVYAALDGTATIKEITKLELK